MPSSREARFEHGDVDIDIVFATVVHGADVEPEEVGLVLAVGAAGVQVGGAIGNKREVRAGKRRVGVSVDEARVTAGRKLKTSTATR